MQKIHLVAAAASAALLSLAGCNSGPEVINEYDPMAEALQNAAPVELPPAIQHSRTYRCSDNSLIYVVFYTNNTAMLRTSQDGTPTALTAAGGNPPFTAPGYSVSSSGESVRITAPGKNNLSCRA
jgi:hypothetical protein